MMCSHQMKPSNLERAIKAKVFLWFKQGNIRKPESWHSTESKSHGSPQGPCVCPSQYHVHFVSSQKSVFRIMLKIDSYWFYVLFSFCS